MKLGFSTNISALLVALLIACFASYAQSGKKDAFSHLQVELKNGETIQLPILGHPAITRSDAGLVFTYDDKRYECDWADINQIRFLKESTSITPDAEITDTRSITFDRGSITLSGFKPTDRCLIMKLDGVVVKSFEIADDGCAVIDTGRLTPGVYIATIGNKSIKIIKQ